MRILFINYCYESYWKQFYARQPNLEKLPYQAQVDAFLHDSFASYGTYSYYLREYGYECDDFLYNVEPLQRVWSEENRVKWDKASFEQENALEKIKRFKPDIVFLLSSKHNQSWVNAAREACPTIRLFVRWCAVSVPMDSLKGYDLILTSTRGIEQSMRNYGLNVRRIPLAFDHRVLKRVGNVGKKDIPLSFIGSICFSKGFHLRRAKILHLLLCEHLLTPFIQVNYLSQKRQLYLRVMRKALSVASIIGFSDKEYAALPLIGRHLVAGQEIDLSLLQQIAAETHGPLYGLEMYKAMAKSLATFNVHINAAGDYVGNVRMYEATGMGTCMLTDWKKDLNEFFEIDKEVISYKSPEEAVEKAKWLAQNPQQCVTIGRAAQQRVLNEHTYRHRAALMHEIFKEQLINKRLIGGY